MATLIAANYQSTTITSYGGMSISCGTLKANTLYTLKCRYKYTKNTSTSPQILCYNSNWSHTGGIYDATDDGIMKTRIVKFTSYTSAINYNISCYAWSYNNQNNGVGGKTGVLEVDWYELWEGDATQFSLIDAYELGTNNLFKWGDKPTATTGVGNNGASVSLDSSTFGYNVYKCVSTSTSSQMYIYYNSAALNSSLVVGKTYLATAEIYSPDSSACNINIESSSIVVHSRSITPGQWSKVWVIGTRTANGGAITFYAPAGTYYYKNIHIAETPISFLDLQNNYCSNTGYFSTVEPKNALRSWMGYYYKTQSTTSYSDWIYTYASDYTGATRSRTVTTYDHYSNGKVVQTGSSTQSESAAVTNGSWSYNWTTTGNSTRSRTVTYTWGDSSTTTKTQTQTGGARYIVLDSFSDGKSEGSVHEFSAAGGSITARTVSHDYWPDTSGTHIQTVVITGVTTTCTGFTCSTSGSTVTITAASKGTTESAANTATITSTKTGWVTRSYGSCKQAENKITSVSLSAAVSSGTLTAVSAAGGTVTWTPTVKYSSGSTSSDTSKFTPTYTVANYTTLTGFATKSYSASTGNYNYQQIGGSYSVASGEKFLCTLGSASVTAGSPAGYTILAYDLSENQNRGGVQLSNSKLTNVITSNAADTVEFILYAGVGGATAGVAVTYNNLCISRMNTAGSGATQSGNKTTWASLGTTTGGRNASVTVSVKSSYTTTAVTATAYTAQAYNTITSYDTPQMKGVKWSALIAAGGGTATPTVTSYNQVATWSSGSKSNITSGASISFARAQIVKDTDPEFYNGANSINKYDNANSGKTTLTRITSGYPSGIPNNSGVAYKIQNTGSGAVPNLGGFFQAYAGTAGQTYLWTFDAYVPSGYTLQHNHNSLGTGGSFTWRSPSSGTGSWRTYSIEVYFGTSNSSAFFCSLVGTAGTSSAPVVWYIANSKICKISNVSATSPTINTSTGAVTLGTRGTTIGSAGVVDTYGAVLGTITMNGKTGKFVAAPSQQANAVTSIKAEVANTDTSSCHWYVSPGTSSNKIAAAGGTGTVVGNGTCKFTFTSGSTEYKGSSGDYKGNTLSFSRTYKISGTTATTSNGFTLNTSTGAVTASNNTTTSDRNVNITSDLTVSWGSLSNTLSQSCYVYQAAGTRTYQIVLDPSSITWAASGGSQSVTVKYNTLWNNIKTAGPTALTGYSIDSQSNCTTSGTSGTTTVTVGQNTTSGTRNVGARFYKTGYTDAILTGIQNKPVTSTETVYRVSSLSSSALTINYSSGTGSISVYMDKATRTYYKNTTSSAAFTTTTGTWSRVTGQEAAAAGSSLGLYTYFESINGGDTGWIRSGTPTYSLANGTSTSAAIWYVNYAYDTNTNTERQVKMLIVHSTTDDVSGAGKNYCTITQSAGPAQIPIQVWGRNENGTDIYCLFSQCKVMVYQDYTTSWTQVENLSWGGGVSGYDGTSARRQLVNGDWDTVDRIPTANSIVQVKIDFGTTTIENTVDSSHYRCCEVWAEVCEGDPGSSYSSGIYKSSTSVISTNYSPLQSSDGGTHTFQFYGSGVDASGNYYSGAPLNDNSVVVIFFRFYNS